MANIKITTQHTLYDGIPITFRAPCGSANVDGLVIGSRAFTLCDTNGNTYLKADGLFSKGAYVRVILDTTKNLAYLQGVGGSSSAASDSGYEVGDIKHTFNANQSPEWLYCDGTVLDGEMYDELDKVMPCVTKEKFVIAPPDYDYIRPLPKPGQWFMAEYYNARNYIKEAYVYDANTETLTKITCPSITTDYTYGIFGLTWDGERYILGVSEDSASSSYTGQVFLYVSTDLEIWTKKYTFAVSAQTKVACDLSFDGTNILYMETNGGEQTGATNFYINKALTKKTSLSANNSSSYRFGFVQLPAGYWTFSRPEADGITVYKAGSGTALFSFSSSYYIPRIAFFSDRYWIGLPRAENYAERICVANLTTNEMSYIYASSLVEESYDFVRLQGAEYEPNAREWCFYLYGGGNSSRYYAAYISADANPSDASQYRVVQIPKIPETISREQMTPYGQQLRKVSTSEIYVRDTSRKYLPTPESDAYVFINVGKCKERVASGDAVYAADSLYRPLVGLSLYGKSMQDGTPSPASPAPITSVGNTVNITTVGKNLAASSFTHTYSGAGKVSVSCLVDSSEVVLNGTSDAYHSWSVFDNVFLPKGTYTASVDGLNNSDAIVDRVYIYNHTTGSVVVNHIKDHTPRTFTLDKDSTIRFDIVLGGGRTYDNQTVRIQVEHGDRATEYVPYKRRTQTFTAPNGLNGIPVNSGGNYTDNNGQQWICDEIDYERGVYIQRVYKVVLDGSQTFENYRPEENTDTYIGATMKGIPNASAQHYYRAMSTFLSAGTATTQGYYPNTFLCHTSNGALYMRVEIDGVSSLATFKTWLASNPQEVQYVLAEPIETPLSNVTLDGMVTLKGGTTMWNDTHAGMKITYVAGGTSDDET